MTYPLIETYVDLGQKGALCMSRSISSQLPIPALDGSYAHWHKPNGDVVDCRHLFVFEPDSNRLQDYLSTRLKAVTDQGYGSGVYIESIRYLSNAARPGFTQLATHVYGLNEGLVLAVFEVSGTTSVLRVVDLEKESVCYEQCVRNSLSGIALQELSLSALTTLRSEYDLVATANNGQYFYLFKGMRSALVEIGSKGITFTNVTLPKEANHPVLTKSHCVFQQFNTPELTAIALNAPHQRLEYKSDLVGKQGFHFCCASHAERTALSHPKGFIEVLDKDFKRTHLLRPFLAYGSVNQVAIELSPDGRHLVAIDLMSCLVVDLDLMQVAPFDMPGNDFYQRAEVFEPTVQLRNSWGITDKGIYQLNQGELSWTLFENMSGYPIENVDLTAARKRPNRNLKKRMDSWNKFCAKLTPSVATARSKMYGNPHLSSISDWPMAFGRPMLLVCEISFVELAQFHSTHSPESSNPFPPSGYLQFWACFDDDGNLSIDDEFNPDPIHVRWENSDTAQIASHPDSAGIDASSIELTASANTLPQPSSVQLIASPLRQKSHAEYAEIISATQPDDEKPPAQIGGYPQQLQDQSVEAMAFQMRNERALSRSAALKEACEWQLLLQLPTDDHLMWGTDCGVVYLMIHKSDLEARDFSKVLALAQGY